MSDNNAATPDAQLDFDDLDSFSSTFFGQNKEPPEDTTKTSTESNDDTKDDANKEGDEVDQDPEDTPDDLDSEDGDNSPEEDSQEEDEKPSSKKPSRFQERINELTNARREAERREAALIARLDALEKPKDETPTPSKAVEAGVPTPTDQNDDGSDKYPLGEFDPNFIRDLTKHTIAEATAEARAEQQRTADEARRNQESQTLNREWEEKQGPARSRYSDYSESVSTLETVFSDIDPAYGDYLAQTVMALDDGAEVLYYLSKNPDEARDIVKQGATKATIRLARLEAKLAGDDEPQPKPKVSQAPEPPQVNRGSAGGRRTIPDDTDDLDAFSKKFFKSKK